MAKVFSFTSVLRKNMMEKDKPDLYYALAKSSGEIDIDEMEIKDALKTLDYSKYKPESSEGDKTDPENPKPKPDPDDGDEEAPDPTV